MKTYYRIESFNPGTKQYSVLWLGNSFDIAERMMKKSYMHYTAHKLVKVTEETLMTVRKKK